MNAIIEQSIAKGSVTAPPSKSLAHRYIICAALSNGVSKIRNVDLSEDIKATLDCIRALGAKVDIDGDLVTIEGINAADLVNNKSADKKEEVIFKCRESGSTMRFFMGLAMFFGLPSKFYGSQTLRNRPFGIYEDICGKQNIEFVRQGDYIFLNGQISPGEYNIKGNISSQFITGLMFIMPLLKENSIIKLIPPVESRSYINLTIQALSYYGVEAYWQGENDIVIKGNQCYKAHNETVEGDASNAAFLEAFNYIGGSVDVMGCNPDTLQGDAVYGKLFDKLKDCNSDEAIDISDCPDLGPVLFAVAACLNGGYFTGTRRLKMKESDRGTVMCAELAKFGISSSISENEITISGGCLTKASELSKHLPTEVLDGHNDHRIVMSLAIMLSLTGGQISGAQAVTKSYPGFF